jgi:serine/threonine protein phosphatase PrpC
LLKLLLQNKRWQEYCSGPKKNVELIKSALVETYEAIDKALRASDQVKYGLDISGCTAVCVIITPTHIICASVGDSRAVVSSKGTSAKLVTTPLSFDHCPQNPIESERIKAAGGTVEFDRVNGELAMSRAFGDFQYKSNKKLLDGEQMVIYIPDVCIYKRAAEDYMLLLACDGVFDVYSNEDAMETLAVADESEIGRDTVERERALSESIINKAVREGSTDNVSAIVVSL